MTLSPLGSSTAPHQGVDAASVTTPTPEQKKAARDFEAIFLRQLLSSLEKSSGISGGNGSGGQVFRSMMVSALADTASEGGGIGLSEVILKAMLPPEPQGRPELAAHASSTPTDSARPTLPERAPLTPSRDAAASAQRDDPASTVRGHLGEPSSSSRWGEAGRVLTEARPAPMLEGATGFATLARARRAPDEGSGR